MEFAGDYILTRVFLCERNDMVSSVTDRHIDSYRHGTTVYLDFDQFLVTLTTGIFVDVIDIEIFEEVSFQGKDILRIARKYHIE